MPTATLTAEEKGVIARTLIGQGAYFLIAFKGNQATTLSEGLDTTKWANILELTGHYARRAYGLQDELRQMEGDQHGEDRTGGDDEGAAESVGQWWQADDQEEGRQDPDEHAGEQAVLSADNADDEEE